MTHPWLDLTLTLQATDAGHEGILSYGGVVYEVRAWRKASSGVVKAEVRLQRDAVDELFEEKAE